MVGTCLVESHVPVLLFLVPVLRRCFFHCSGVAEEALLLHTTLPHCLQSGLCCPAKTLTGLPPEQLLTQPALTCCLAHLWHYPAVPAKLWAGPKDSAQQACLPQHTLFDGILSPAFSNELAHTWLGVQEDCQCFSNGRIPRFMA